DTRASMLPGCWDKNTTQTCPAGTIRLDTRRCRPEPYRHEGGPLSAPGASSSQHHGCGDQSAENVARGAGWPIQQLMAGLFLLRSLGPVKPLQNPTLELA